MPAACACICFRGSLSGSFYGRRKYRAGEKANGIGIDDNRVLASILRGNVRKPAIMYSSLSLADIMAAVYRFLRRKCHRIDRASISAPQILCISAHVLLRLWRRRLIGEPVVVSVLSRAWWHEAKMAVMESERNGDELK